MKRVLTGIGLAAALSFAASSEAQVAEAPIPAQPPSVPAVSPASPYAPPPSPAAPPPARIEMPSPPAPAQQQGTTRPEPRPPHYRAHARRRAPASHVDRSAADYFTHQLNQRELESMETGGGMRESDTPRAPWRDLYPSE